MKCSFCEAKLNPDSLDYATKRSRVARERDDRPHVRCPHCTETAVLAPSGALLDPGAGLDALAFADDEERRYGPANTPSDYGEG